MRFTLLCTLVILITSCKQEISATESITYPSDNPLNDDVAAFGEKLFFDKRLSKDNTISCASCHNPVLAFADTVSVSSGVEGKLGFRNAPSLLNVAFKSSLMLDGAVTNLEMQAIVPIQDHNEMAISMGDLVKKLSQIKEYNAASNKLFNRDIDAFVITRALANYERTLVSRNSRFDKFLEDKGTHPLYDREQLGWNLFKNKGCLDCHSLPDFTNHKISETGFVLDVNDLGRFRITADSADIGKFVVPSLRNVSRTYPYLHNGSIRSLERVVQEHYNQFHSFDDDIYPPIESSEAHFITHFLGSLDEVK